MCGVPNDESGSETEMTRQTLHNGQRLVPCPVLAAYRIEWFGLGDGKAMGRRRD
jgi:hypothetical protein